MPGFVTVAEVKERENIDGTDHDDMIDDLISTVTSYVTTVTGRVWSLPGSVSRSFHAVDDVRGRDLLTGDDIYSVDQVINGDGADLAGKYTVIRPQRIRLLANSGVVWNWNGAEDPTNAIVVTAVWGQSPTSAVPLRVKQLTLEMVCWLYRKRESSQSSDFIVARGGSMVLRPGDLPAELERELYALTGFKLW